MISKEELSKIPALSHVRITTKKQDYEGKILPQEGEHVVLKMPSGYNVGLLPKNIEKIDLLENDKEREQTSTTTGEEATNTKQDAKENKKTHSQQTLPTTVRILHTGGTIASKVDYASGGVIADFDPEALIELFPELTTIAKIESEFLGNMFSDDFRFAHFNTIAKAVQKAILEGTKQIIVTSGTDFLHYLSAALSYILQDYDVGVLVVGSQRSSDRGSTDAAMNLICATQFLAMTKYRGVGVCMHENTDDNTCLILPGINTRKMHSSRRDAFKPINQKPLARVHYELKNIQLFTTIETTDDEETEPVSEKKELPLFKEDLKIGLLYSHPNMYAEEFKTYENFDGLVIAGSGLGHIPITNNSEETKEHDVILETISEIAQKIPVVMSVQTIYGRVHLNVYAPARTLQEKGILGHLNALTPESTYIKLAWILSNHEAKDVPTFFEKQYKGEPKYISFDEY